MLDLKSTLIRLLAEKSETEVVEFKKAADGYDFEKIGKYFSALSNEANLRNQNYAWLVFGVQDKDKSIVSTNYRNNRDALHALKRELADKTTHRITFVEIHELIIDHKRVLLFQIPAAPRGIPVAWSGHYYGRDGESLGPLNLEEIERIRRQQKENDWSNVVEREDSQLMFTNMGSFIPGTIENVIRADAPESCYRNAFLAKAMVQLNMIDTIGSGIKRMFNIQRKKFFPLPEYAFPQNQVCVTFTGKILDINYARKLAQLPDLALEEIILLDKIQKGKPLADSEAVHLRKRKLIEGRKPHFHISVNVADRTGQKVDYLKMRGIDDNYIRKMIVDLLQEFREAKKADFEALLLDKISDALDEKQKKDKIKNILQSMRRANIINNLGKVWRMSKPD